MISILNSNGSNLIPLRRTRDDNVTSIVVGACIKQQAATLERGFLADMEAWSKQWPRLRVVVVVGNSTDSTRSILTRSGRVTLLDADDRGGRTDRLAACRNALWRFAVRAAPDWFVAMDTDYVGSFRAEAVFRSMDRCRNVSACFGNTYLHYDYWALRDARYDFTDVWRDGLWRHLSRPPLRLEGGLHPVRSAFNGVGLYNMRRLPADCEYTGRYVDGYPICEHVPFHACLRNGGASLAVDPRLLVPLASPLPIFTPSLYGLIFVVGAASLVVWRAASLLRRAFGHTIVVTDEADAREEQESTTRLLK